MRSVRLALMAVALAAPALLAASGPANAICFKKCTGINPSGACTGHETVCEELLQSVADKLKPLRDGMRCKTQGLLCDYTGCKPVCGAPPKKKK